MTKTRVLRHISNFFSPLLYPKKCFAFPGDPFLLHGILDTVPSVPQEIGVPMKTSFHGVKENPNCTKVRAFLGFANE